MTKFKKITSLILALMLIACVFCACGDTQGDNEVTTPAPIAPIEPKTADELWQLSMDKMNSLKNYTLTTSGKMQFNMEVPSQVPGFLTSKTSIVSTFVGTAAYSYYDGELRHLEESSSTLTVNGKNEQSSIDITGYLDGKMFACYETNGIKNRFYSNISQADYEAFMLENNDEGIEDTMNSADFGEKSFSQNADKSWDITMSKPSGETLDFLKEMTAALAGLVSVSDATFAATIRADFTVSAMRVDFVLKNEQESATSSMVIEAKVENVGTTVVKTTDISRYTEVDDLRVLTWADDALKDRLDADAGKFELTLSQKILVGAEEYKSSESDSGIFSSEDGYNYKITSENDGGKFEMSYKNGKQTVTNLDTKQSQTSDVDELSARAFIKGLLDCGEFSIDNVTEIKILSDGKYQFFTTRPDMSFAEQITQTVDSGSLMGSAMYTFTVADGKLTEYECKLNAKWRTKGTDCSVSIDGKCVYN